MTDSKVTLNSLIEEQRLTADQNFIDLTREEIREFFEKALAANVTATDIRNSKNRIIACWVDMTWNDAKKRHPHWKEKDWWQQRFNSVVKAYGECYKELFSKEKPKTQEEMFAHMPVFTNVEDLMAWKAKRAANGNG